MTHRTTFALDGDTKRRLKTLAARWRVSQAEVVRRAVSQAEGQQTSKADPVAMLESLHAAKQGLSRKAADGYLDAVNADRKRWRGE